MAGVHGAKTPLRLGSLRGNLVAVFWTVGQRLLLVGENTGTLGKKCGAIPMEAILGIIGLPHSFVRLQAKVKEVKGLESLGRGSLGGCPHVLTGQVTLGIPPSSQAGSRVLRG